MHTVIVPVGTVGKNLDTYAQIFLTYVRKLYKYSISPITIFPGVGEDILRLEYARADGVFLLGGEDINPKHYGQSPHPCTEYYDSGRDELELKLLKWALEDRKPFLGVCRGMQMLNIALGGTLTQHLPDVTSEVHLLEPPHEYQRCLQEFMHTVQLRESSRSARLLGKSEILVNSGHHQAIAELGQGLECAGISPGGIIEMVEHQDKNYFCFGVQPHPEVHEESDLEPLFAAFEESMN